MKKNSWRTYYPVKCSLTQFDIRITATDRGMIPLENKYERTGNLKKEEQCIFWYWDMTVWMKER